MKKSLFGLGAGVLLMLLMLACMVSAPAEEKAPPIRPLPAPPCALRPAAPSETRDSVAEKERADGREEVFLPAVRQPSYGRPCASASGDPPLRQTFRRANFRAFHYSDGAG